jgi:hypothetical protein
MPRIPILAALVFSLFPLAAQAADASASPKVDCLSAAPRPKDMDFATWKKYCLAQTGAKRAASATEAGAAPAAASGAVVDNLKTPDTLDFSSVPQWSDYDINDQFAKIRDNRYMTVSNFQRRISWMYPDDGCFARAEQFDVLAANSGKARPYKMFAMGDLRVSTNNHPNGYVEWGWHVVPVVRNRDKGNMVIVFDPSLSPCRPLPYKEWLILMADLSHYTNPANGYGVAVADSNAYHPWSLQTGEPSHATESLQHQTGTYLPAEWSRQSSMGRTPEVILGPTPPWSGYNCVSVTRAAQVVDVAPGATATLTATCPYATLAVGGGYNFNTARFAVSKDAMSGNGWQIKAKNTGSSTEALWASAHCLIGAPYGASVGTIQGNVTSVNGQSYASSNATCSSGKLVSGGFTTTEGSTLLRIYKNGRTSNTGSTWQVSAQNPTSSAKQVTSFAYCLQGTNLSFAQTTSPGADSSGFGNATCASPTDTLMGTGWVFPRTTAYTLQQAYDYKGYVSVVWFSPMSASGDANAKAYAECMGHP